MLVNVLVPGGGEAAGGGLLFDGRVIVETNFRLYAYTGEWMGRYCG